MVHWRPRTNNIISMGHMHTPNSSTSGTTATYTAAAPYAREVMRRVRSCECRTALRGLLYYRNAASRIEELEGRKDNPWHHAVSMLRRCTRKSLGAVRTCAYRATRPRGQPHRRSYVYRVETIRAASTAFQHGQRHGCGRRCNVETTVSCYLVDFGLHVASIWLPASNSPRVT